LAQPATKKKKVSLHLTQKSFTRLLPSTPSGIHSNIRAMTHQKIAPQASFANSSRPFPPQRRHDDTERRRFLAALSSKLSSLQPLPKHYLPSKTGNDGILSVFPSGKRKRSVSYFNERKVNIVIFRAYMECNRA
jgi:hypothetical protein